MECVYLRTYVYVRLRVALNRVREYLERVENPRSSGKQQVAPGMRAIGGDLPFVARLMPFVTEVGNAYYRPTVAL